MATTERGIYYQDDYTKAADILADMKKMAESTDDAIKKSEYNDKDVKDSIKEIQDKQTLQDKNIENIQTKKTQQDELIQKLQNNMIQESTEEATSLHVKDASDLPAKLNIRGNHYQKTQEGTSNLAILQEGTIEQDGITVDIKEGNIKINGTNTTTNTLSFKVGTVKLIEGETYYLKRFGTVNGTGLFLNNSGTQIWGQNSEISFIAKATGTFAISLTVGTSTINNTIQQILVSKISGRNWIEGKVPIPSVEYPSEISTVKDNIKIIQCNSNFLKKQEKTEVSARGLTGTVSSDGTITLNGTTTGTTYIQITDELKILDFAGSKNLQKHVLAKGKYIFSVEKTGQTNNNNVHVYLRTSSSGEQNFNISITKISESDKKETKFEMSDRKDYVAYIYIPENITFTDFTMKFMLKRADDNSEYVQNEQKEYNLAVQQKMLLNDKFDLFKNKEVHTWKKVEKTDVSEFTVTKTNNTFKFYFKVSNANNTSTILSKLFKNYKNSFSNTGTAMEWNGNLNVVFKFGDCGFTESMTVEEAKIRFQEIIDENTSLIFYYSMTTTEELELTEEQKETLNQLNNLELFKGTNNIYTEQDLALLQLNYTADTKMYIDNKINSILGGN